MENQNLNILDEVNKGATMGMDAISFVSEKVKDNDFRKVLDVEYNKYKEISNKVNDLYSDYSSADPHETNAMNKMMTWYGIQKDTILDDSVSKLADLLINGTNMGIIEGRKLLNNKTMDKKVHKLCNEYVKVQEKYIEKLKKFL